MRLRIPFLYIAILAAIISAVIFVVAWMTGIVSFEKVFDNFIVFVIMLISITTVAILGAIMIGMFISHRLLATGGFTPFEKSMLEMKADITKLRAAVERLETLMGEEKVGGEKED